MLGRKCNWLLFKFNLSDFLLAIQRYTSGVCLDLKSVCLSEHILSLEDSVRKLLSPKSQDTQKFTRFRENSMKK